MKFEVGNTYYDGENRPVRIISTDRRHPRLSVIGLVDDGNGKERIAAYTTEGRFFEKRTTSHDIKFGTPWDDFKVDEPVMVRDNHAWVMRYFAGVKGGLPHAWENGCTSLTAERPTIWSNCRRPTADELEARQKHFR